ncbi:MAG TPA: hypothetical protein VMM12_12985 [Longimicrobiales bacterium]|nr:hypothetical protein [Longimicrobiales bacterium]
MLQSPGAAARLLAALLLLAACGDDPVDPDPACGDAPPLPFGRTVAESLLPASDALLDGSLIDYYSLYPEGPGTVTIEMGAERSGDHTVDPFLYLWSQDLGDPLAQAYDPTGVGPLRVARLTLGVSSGCYRVGASTWRPSEAGEYTIRAEFIPAP